MRKWIIMPVCFALAVLFVHMAAQNNPFWQQQKAMRFKLSVFKPDAQLGNEIFLQGQFIEVGIHSAGSFGTEQTAPVGFHTWPEYSSGPYPGLLGFVADYGKDGWAVGTPPQTGDFFVPGSPEEGWAVEWTLGGIDRTFDNFGLEGDFDIPLISSSETSSGSTRSAVWQGEAASGSDEKLHVTQTVHFDQSKLYFIIDVVLTNTGTVALDSVEYLRNVDPDQEEPITGIYTTSNYVAYQPGVDGNSDKALVVAQGLTYGLTLGLGAVDARARVSTEGFSNRDPDEILDSPVTYPQSAPNIADQAIALAFRLGTLAPGQSVSFSCTYILSQADLEEALIALNPCVPPHILTEPQGQTIIYGQTAALSVKAVGTDPLKYQWYKGLSGDISRPISGATSTSYTTPVLEDEYNYYWVRVDNDCGRADSATATVKVEFPAYPALNFRLTRVESDFIFFKEYINRLSWEANPQNVKEIVSQKIFRKAKGAADSAYQLVKELGPNEFSYEERGLKKADLYMYRLVLVNEKGRESTPIEVSN
jgi:hypothetical protein